MTSQDHRQDARGTSPHICTELSSARSESGSFELSVGEWVLVGGAGGGRGPWL